ncbi:MAG: hypothetical protein HY347_05430 [candidate division NC10 bacterium]|nr:hypothetical protein [candidate division NC10 bacterium]
MRAVVSVVVASVLLAVAAVTFGQEGETKTHQGGGVTIEATYLGVQQEGDREVIKIEVKMDTHSVGLDQYQMEALSALRDGQGRELRPVRWVSASGGGHHRAGVLLFPVVDSSGRPFIAKESQYLELVIRNVAGVKERTFRWKPAQS